MEKKTGSKWKRACEKGYRQWNTYKKKFMLLKYRVLHISDLIYADNEGNILAYRDIERMP